MVSFARWAARICLIVSLTLPFLPPVKPQQAHAASGTTVRQEINITDIALSGTNATVSSNELVQLDTTQYSGTATYYFEVIAQVTAGGTGNIRLRRAGTTTDDSTIAVSSLGTVATQVRSAFTPQSGQTQYFLFGDAAGASKTLTIKEARIIVVQTSDPLTKTEGQFEIGDDETGLALTTAGPLSFPKYWKYTAANWDGNKTFSAEVTTGRTGSATTTIVLQQDNGSFASWTNVATIVSNTTTTTARYRVTFTPTDGRNYRLASSESASTAGRVYAIYNGKIIVDQNSSTVQDSYSETNQDNFDVLNAGGRIVNAQSFTASATNALTQAVFYIKIDAGAPTGNAVAKLYTHSGTFGTSSVPTGAALATSDSVNVATFTANFQLISFNFSGANQVTLTSGTHYEIGLYYNSGDTLNRIRVGHDASSSTASGNRAFTSDESAWTTSANDMVFYVYGGNTSLLHLETQYLLLNTQDAGTGRNGFRSLWDQTEWVDTSNTYFHTMDSDNASNSCSVQDADNADSTITNTTVTGANQVVSSAFTMPTSGHHIINNVIATPGTIAADRILVVVNIIPVSVTITTDGSVAYGTVAVSAAKDTTSGGVNDTQAVNNNGTNAEDVNIAGQNSSGWSLAATPGANAYEEDFCTAGSGSPDPCDTGPTWTAITTSYQLLASNLAASATKRFDLRLDTPTSSASSTQQSVDVTIQVVAH